MVYIIMFVITILFTYIAERNFDKKNKFIGVIFSILAIALPSIVAGLRNLDIGLDISVYVEQNFQTALQSQSFKECLGNLNTDFLYIVINYIISRMSDNINVLLFIIELINMTLLYLFIYNKRKSIHMWLAMTVYLMVFYNISLNLVRQSLAISVILFSMRYVENKKIIKFIICILIATLLHSTAIFSIPIYFIFNILNKKHKGIYKIVILLGITFAVLNYENIIHFLVYDVGILSIKYANYITIFSREELDFNFAAILFRVFWIIMALYCYKKLKIIDANNEIYIYFIILDLVLNQVRNFCKLC